MHPYRVENETISSRGDDLCDQVRTDGRRQPSWRFADSGRRRSAGTTVDWQSALVECLKSDSAVEFCVERALRVRGRERAALRKYYHAGFFLSCSDSPTGTTALRLGSWVFGQDVRPNAFAGAPGRQLLPVFNR